MIYISLISDISCLAIKPIVYMKKNTTKIVASILGGLALTALLMANVFAASTDGTMLLKTNVAKADDLKCYGEVVGCTKADGSAGSKSVCDATAKGVSCVCGSASPCE